jgi:hypothetical protein
MRNRVWIMAAINLIWVAAISIMCWRCLNASATTDMAFHDAVRRAETANAEKLRFLKSDYAEFLYRQNHYYLLGIVACGIGFMANGVAFLALRKAGPTVQAGAAHVSSSQETAITVVRARKAHCQGTL